MNETLKKPEKIYVNIIKKNQIKKKIKSSSKGFTVYNLTFDEVYKRCIKACSSLETQDFSEDAKQVGASAREFEEGVK